MSDWDSNEKDPSFAAFEAAQRAMLANWQSLAMTQVHRHYFNAGWQGRSAVDATVTRVSVVQICDEVAADYDKYDDVTAREIKMRVLRNSPATTPEKEKGT